MQMRAIKQLTSLWKTLVWNREVLAAIMEDNIFVYDAMCQFTDEVVAVYIILT